MNIIIENRLSDMFASGPSSKSNIEGILVLFQYCLPPETVERVFSVVEAVTVISVDNPDG